MKIKTNWNLGLFYKNEDDPQIEKDVQSIEKLFADFEKKYGSTRTYLSNESALHKTLTDFETLQEKASWKPLMYLHYATDLNSANEKAEALKSKLTQRLVTASNKIVFFTLALVTIKPTLQKKFLKSKKLAHFHYFLKVLFDTSKHNLTEAEEKILNIKYLPSHGLWVDGVQKLVSKQTVQFEGKTISLPEAIGKIPQLNVKKRRALHDKVMASLKNISDFPESEINALYTDKKSMDELRQFEKPYSATILAYQNDEQSVMNLVKTVTDGFTISADFYNLKSKLLKTSQLEYADRAADIGDQHKKVPFEKGLDLFKRSLTKIPSPLYSKIFETFMDEGRIDVYPQKGKRGGAYCSSDIGTPTMVLLNYTDSLDSVMTLGHEMGHGFHAELSKRQKPLYQDHTISVAEVASTFFENIVFEEIFETLTDKEKIIALHDRLNDDVSTIFRQIACFNFELELHETIRKEGFLSKEKIAALHNKHMSAYLGPKVTLKENDGYFFVNWMHIRSFFYVYSYAYGQIISKALYKKYQEDKKFIFQIEKFLSAGSSKSPEDIFKEIGIDTSKPEFFKAGLEQVKSDLIRLEKLAKSAKLI